MNDIKEIEQFKKYNLFLVPLGKEKQPKSKPDVNGQYSWKYSDKVNKKLIEWSDQELLKAEGLGVSHQHSKIVDVDFDNPIAQEFVDCFPSTFSIGKKKITHLLYKVDEINKSFSYPKTSVAGGKYIELLTKTQTVLKHSDGSRKIFNDRAPLEAKYKDILEHVKMTALFTELHNVWPKPASERRDDAWLRLMGAFVRDCPDVSHKVILKFSKRFCKLQNDDEVDNRLGKLQYWYDRHKENPKDVFGIDGVAKFLNVNIPAFDELKKENVESNEDNTFEEDDIIFPMIDGSSLLDQKYEQPQFMLEPLIREKTITQISGGYGSGKTHLGLAVALSLAHNRDFLDYKIRKDNPVLYVEGELPADDLRERIIGLNNSFIEKHINDEKTILKPEYQYTLFQDDLINAGIKYGFPRLAIADDETKALVGRRAIEDLATRIKIKTGKWPVIFLDNFSAFAQVDENKAKDWTTFMHWLISFKTKGASLVLFHHTNKSTGSASGSNMSQRFVDTHIITRALDEKHRFNLNGKNVQCTVHFDKFRNFGGEHVQPFMLTCTEDGIWKKYPILKANDRKIIEYHDAAMPVKDMVEKFAEDNVKISEKTLYRRIKELKFQGLILDVKEVKKKINL